MAKSGNNDFNNSKFYNAKFFNNGNNGNTSRNIFQGNSALNNLESAGNQNKNQVQSSVDNTLEAYTAMYGSLKELHNEYIRAIDKREFEHYRLLTSPNENGFIYRQYNEMYKALEKRHQDYLKNLGNIQIPQFVNINVPSKSSKKSRRSNRTEVPEETRETSGNSNYDDIFKISVQNIADSLKKIEEKLVADSQDKKDDKSEELKKKEQDEKNRQELIAKDEARSATYTAVANKAISSFESLSSNIVGSDKNVSGLLSGITSTLSSFVQGGPYAAAATAIMSIANAVTQFFGQAVGEHYQVMEDNFTNYGIYTRRWNDQLAGYTKDILDKQTELYALDLEDNIRSTDWMKSQIDLASKGFDADRAEDAALQDLILNKIAPHLDTSSSIFMDFQQRGLLDITESLGGLVESVRGIAGSSRISQATLSTMTEQLGPIELYAKKNLITGEMADVLAAIEASGAMSTEDAINLVTTATEAFAHPEKLLSGTTVEKLAIIDAMQSGTENPLDLIWSLLGGASTFSKGIPKIGTMDMQARLLSGIVGGSVGYGNYLSSSANPVEVEKAIRDAYISGNYKTEEPQSAYKELVEEFDTGVFQTVNERLEVMANNSELAAGANGFLHQISEWLFNIWESVVDITDWVLGRDSEEAAERRLDTIISISGEDSEERNRLLMRYMDTHEVPSDILKKFANAMDSGIPVGGAIADEYAKKYDPNYVSPASNKNKYLSYAYSGVGGKYGQEYYNSLYSEELRGTGAPGDPNNLNIESNATGGYVDRPTLSWVAENQPEIISPVPQLVSAVAKGIEYSSKMKPDYSDIISAMNIGFEAVVEAIKEDRKGVSTVLDSNTGLIGFGAGTKNFTSLRPRMGR